MNVERGTYLAGRLQASQYAASLGYRLYPDRVECEACAMQYHGAAANGAVMRGHRRRCPVAPREVPTPGVCDS